MTDEIPAPGEAARRPGDVVETHVSVLLFHDDVVLKLKKALALPFLDYTTVEARRRCCDMEVEANRRLAPDVYLGVATLTLGERALDHAVVMRRMPADRSLAGLTATRPPGLAGEIRRLAGVLATFHRGAARAAQIDDAARRPALSRTWERLLDTLRPFAGSLVDGELLAEIAQLSRRYLAGRDALLEQRIADGRICDGHGDLLADDVFLLDDGPRVLDCLEFDPALRAVDVVADVAFLAMDLERLGALDLAEEFLRCYQDEAGERFPPTLLHHYVAERAVVRAEVACLRAAQSGDAQRGAADAGRLLAIAQSHLRAGRVVLGVVSGLPGTGKSTVATAAGERLRWPVLRSDEIRRELFCPSWTGPMVESRLPGLYSDESTARTYTAMLERAGDELRHGRSVLLDATFAAPGFRRQAEDLARDTSSDLVAVVCTAPDDVAAERRRERLAAGRDLSGADDAVAHAMAARSAAWPQSVALDTTGNLSDSVDRAVALFTGGAVGLLTGGAVAPADVR